jgi:hypothetical protein
MNAHGSGALKNWTDRERVRGDVGKRERERSVGESVCMVCVLVYK